MSDRAYNWDDTVEKPNEGEFTLLPGGVYPFEVTKMERARHDGSDNLPPCYKAILHLRIDGGDAGQTTIKHHLFLHSKCDGLLCAFFTAIGHRKHGEPLRMDWGRVEGATGHAHIEVREYTSRLGGERRKTNNVTRFLDPPSVKTSAATAQPAASDDGEESIPF